MNETGRAWVYSSGQDSVVGIATRYKGGGPADLIPVGARVSVPVQTLPEAHPAFCTTGTGSFPRGITADTCCLPDTPF
jgi:hypothetical protein